MPILKKAVRKKTLTTVEKTSFMRKYLVPTYIILSAFFILYILYGYFQGVVYQSGLSNGQQQGYRIAVIDLMNQVSSKCEPVALTFEDQQVDVINLSCIQAQEQAQAQTLPESLPEGESIFLDSIEALEGL